MIWRFLEKRFVPSRVCGAAVGSLWAYLPLFVAALLVACQRDRDREVDVAESADQRSAAESHFEEHGNPQVDEGARPTATAEPVTEQLDPEGTESTGPLTGGAVLGLLRAVDAAEIGSAQAIMKSGRSPEVRALAELILQDHQALQREVTAALGTEVRPESGASSRAIAAAADSALVMLKAAGNPATADQIFLTSQVAAHRQALAAVDRLRARARDAKVVEILEDARARMQDHLKRAEHLMTTATEPDRSDPTTQPPPLDPST